MGQFLLTTFSIVRIRAALAVGIVGLLAVESAYSQPVEPISLVEKSLNQGGLLAVVLVLFWYIRNTHQQRLQEKEDRLAVLMDLVLKNTEASTKQTEAIHAQAKSIDAQARSIDNLVLAVRSIEERRTARE